MITQRISTIQNCDRIVVLDQGKIVEIGNHEVLYNLGGIYTKIYNTMYKAQTKPLEVIPVATPQAVEIISQNPPFNNLTQEDAAVAVSFYEETYPDEESRLRAEQKTIKRIEKAQQSELKKQKEESKELKS